MTRENPLEQKKQQEFVDITFNPDETQQRFVEFEDVDGNHYVYSCTTAEANHHKLMFDNIVKKLKLDGKITKRLGGFLEKDGNKIYIMGRSTALGRFNKEKVLKSLKEHFKNMEVIYQEIKNENLV